MNEKLKELETTKLRTNKNKLHQTDARNYKADLHEVFMDMFKDLDLMVTEVDNGFIIEMPHEEFGAIPIEAKFIIKPLDYDVISAGEMYQLKLDNKAAKEKAEREKGR